MSSRAPILMVISSGRTGTTTLAEYLRCSPSRARVYHERFKAVVTRPAENFRLFEAEQLRKLSEQPAIREFFSELAAEDVPYVDTGWTVYPLVPLLIERFPERMRLLILTRHPVPTAASLALHGLYETGREADLGRAPDPFVQPDSPRVYDPIPLAEWERMSLFARNLFRVAQIYKFADEVRRRYPEVPARHVRIEELSSVLPSLAEYAGVEPPTSPDIPHANPSRWLARAVRGVGPEWRDSATWPWAVEAAAMFGYRLDPEGLEQIEPMMDKFRRRGGLEHALGAIYRVRGLRRAWRRWVWPLYRRRRSGPVPMEPGRNP